MSNQTSYSATETGKLLVSGLTLGGEVDDIFIISAAQQGQARNGPYWRIELRDSSGSISGKIWSPQSQAYPELLPGWLVQAKGRVTSYRDQLEISIESLRILSDEERSGLDLSLFLLSSPYRPDDMMDELLELADRHLSHRPWHMLITGLLRDGEIGMALRLAPAAKSMHHAYAGGLLEHTLSVTRLCMRLADHYPGLDRQVLFAGAVCHDLGKLWELSSGLVVEYTQAGKLLGHIFLFLERLDPFLRRSGLEPELAEHLKHLILSHHGSYEFGSPRLPATAEALTLHYADILDAKMQQVEKALSGLEDESWSPYITSLERSLFKAKPSPVKAVTEDIDKLVSEIDAVYPAHEALPADPFSSLHEKERNGDHVANGEKSETEEGGTGRGAGKKGATGANSQHLPLFSQCSSPLKE